MPLVLAALALSLGAEGAERAERAKAKVDCTPAEHRYVYDCTIMLTGKKSGKPIAGAEVGAEMPSMPMAHNTKPVKAMAMQQPDMYRARIELAMHGEWVLTREVSGATRDKLIHTMQFRPIEGEHAGLAHDQGAMKHEHGEMTAASGTSCPIAVPVTDEPSARRVGRILRETPRRGPRWRART